MDLMKEPSDEGQMALLEQINHSSMVIVNEFLSEKHEHQPMKLVPASKLKRIWGDFTSTGFVRDEKGLENILDRIVENFCRIEVNNVISGHTQLPSKTILEDYLGEDDRRVEELQERFSDWAIDLPDGKWRISDYGTPRMFKPLALALEAKTQEQRLLYLDIVLNIAHQRSDLSSWFIEGGSSTLASISGEGLTH